MSARQERIDNTVKNWHFQYQELARLNKVPAIKDPTDPEDEGINARKRLIIGIGNIIDEVRKTNPNSDYTPSVSEALVRYPNILKGVPGDDLPISGNTVYRDGGSKLSYDKDIKGKSFQQIVDQG